MSNVRPHQMRREPKPKCNRKGQPGPSVLRRPANQLLFAAKLSSTVSLGCPSFGGQRTIGVTRKKCVESSHFNQGSFQ